MAGFRQKSSYVYLAACLSLVFLAVNVADYATVSVARRPGLLSLSWRSSLLLLHAMAYFFNLVGFVYAVETGERPAVRAGAAAFAVNLVAYAVRVDYEVRFLGLSRQSYKI